VKWSKESDRLASRDSAEKCRCRCSEMDRLAMKPIRLSNADVNMLAAVHDLKHAYAIRHLIRWEILQFWLES
jgi:hypothetical protein